MRSRRTTNARPKRRLRRIGTAAGNAHLRRANAAQALLVLGMHRSGTSAFTRVFSLLGADLPKNLLGQNPTNEAGHWESLDLVAIHDDLLATAGSRWDDWRAFNSDWIRSGVAESYRVKLLGILQNNFGGSHLFVVKDPRICRFVPLWLDVLERFGAEARVVIPIRNPLEVAASLRRRDNSSLARSYLLWLRHVLDAEMATRWLPRAIVIYQELLDDWRSIVGTVTAKADVHWPRRSDRSELEIDQFLAYTLRHHTADDAQLAARADITDWVKEAYRILQQMAAERETKNQFLRLDRIRFEFDKACAAFGLVLESEAERSESQLRSIETQIKVRDEEIVQLSGRLTQAQNAANEAEAASTDHERHRRQVATALEEERATTAKKDAQIAFLGQELETLRAALREQETVATKLRADLESVQLVSNERKGESEKLYRELISAQSAVRDRDGEIGRLSRDIDATRLFLRDSQSEIQRLAGELDAARAETEYVNAERQRISELLRTGIEALTVAAAELPAAQEEIVFLKASLGELCQEADQRNSLINDSSTEAQSIAIQAAEKIEILAANDVRIHDLRAQLDEKSAENDRLASELAQAAAEIPRVEKSAADRAAVLEAIHTAALVECENKAQAQIRRSRDQLIDAEVALANAINRKRNGLAWINLISLSRRRAARQISNSGLFDADWYSREYPDVTKCGRSPAEHYLEDGYLRGYRPNPLFDTRWYLDHYDDVRRSGVNPLVHYLQHGCSEGRNPGPEFETDFYLLSNPDVRSSRMNPLVHYLRYGKTEGRLPMRPHDDG